MVLEWEDVQRNSCVHFSLQLILSHSICGWASDKYLTAFKMALSCLKLYVPLIVVNMSVSNVQR